MPVQEVKAARGRKEAGNHQHVDGGSAAEKRVGGGDAQPVLHLTAVLFPQEKWHPAPDASFLLVSIDLLGRGHWKWRGTGKQLVANFEDWKFHGPRHNDARGNTHDDKEKQILEVPKLDAHEPTHQRQPENLDR